MSAKTAHGEKDMSIFAIFDMSEKDLSFLDMSFIDISV